MQQQTMQQPRQEKGLKSSRWLGAGTAVMMATLSLGSSSSTVKSEPIVESETTTS